MSVQTYVTFSDTDEDATIHVDGQEILDTLGGEEKVAIQLKEVLESVKEAVRGALEDEGELQIEISGSLNLKATGGANYLFFNVGGEANKTNTMKVVLTTKITPQLE